MKRIGPLTIAVALAIAACGGSNDTAAEPDVEVEAVDDDVVREAGDDVQVINGCRIEPSTQCPRADLSGARLSGTKLWDANLSGANLSGAKLSGARLTYADLQGANLSRANLSEADLYGADLGGANLERANLSKVDLSRANLSGARFCNTVMPDGSVRNDNCPRSYSREVPT